MVGESVGRRPVDDTVGDAEILVRALCRLGSAHKAEAQGPRLGRGACPAAPASLNAVTGVAE